MVAHPRSFFSRVATLSPARSPLSGIVSGAWPTEASRVRGPTEACASCKAPPIAIARDGSFAPTQSARTPHCRELVTAPAGVASAAGSPLLATIAASLPDECRLRSFRRSGLPHALLREDERDSLTPEVPSIIEAAPNGAGLPHRLSPACVGNRCLFDSSRNPCLDGREPHSELDRAFHGDGTRPDTQACDRSTSDNFCVRTDPRPDEIGRAHV